MYATTKKGVFESLRAGGQRQPTALPGGPHVSSRHPANHRRPHSPPKVLVLARPAVRRGAVRVCCWAEADANLAELGWLERQLAAIEERRARAVSKAEADAGRVGRALRTRHQRLAAALERFCLRQEPELARVDGHARQTRRLRFGRVGFRHSQAVVIADDAKALRALAHWRAGQRFLRVQTELDREGLREYLLCLEADRTGVPRAGQATARRLRRAGIMLEQRTNWFYQINWRALNHRG